MAAAFSLTIRRLLIIFFIVKIIISLSSLTNASSQNYKIVLKLIHRDSKLSPLYEPNATIWELRKRAIHRSLDRASYLSKSLTAGIINNPNDVIGVDLRPKDDGSTFLANISIGDPPVPQMLVVDTGSSITWVRCEPYGGRHSFPLYNPNKSSTFDRILCNGDCWADEYSCDEQGSCTFEIWYADGSNATGNLIQDELVFTTIGGGTHPIQIYGIGCAHSVTATSVALESASGILGLGRDSLVDQINGKFSYCIGDINDPNYAFNRLVIGEGANLDGDVLSAFGYGQHFFVVMEGISVGEDRLDINPSVFARDHERHDGGVIIDTGSTFTELNRAAYRVLRDKVQSLASNILTPAEYEDPELLCYEGNVDREVSDFPYVTFHFEGGVDLVLGPKSFFLETEPGVVCMAVAASPVRLNVIGVMAQQDYNIGFDTFNANVYIQSIDCSLYFDT